MLRNLAFTAIAAATLGVGYAGSIEPAAAQPHWGPRPHYRPHFAPRPHYFAPRPYFAPRAYYAPRCRIEDRRVWTPYGWRFRPVRVCWR